MVIRGNELIVNDLEPADSGRYTCTASNDAGSDSSDIALDVGSEADIITDISHVRPEIGLSVVLECPYTGNPKPEITWFKDNSRVERSTERVQIEDSRIEISKLQVHDDGIYTCRATNQFGDATHDIRLTVTGLEVPKVDTFNNYAEGKAGDDIKLTCLVSGKPEPEVYWTKNEQRIEPNKGSNLIIYSASLSDAGMTHY